MNEQSSFSPSAWSLDPPEQLLRDPSYITQSASRQRMLILLTGALILLLNPPFYFVLTTFPDIPPESLFTRIFPMALAFVAVPYHLRQRSYTSTRLTIIVLLIIQLICSLTQVIDSMNSPVYVAACLTPLYTCQMIFNRLKDLLLVLGISLGWYIFLFTGVDNMMSGNNALALVLFVSAVCITGLFGAIRIKDLEHTYLTQHESDRKSVALEQAEANARHSAEAALAASRAKSAFLATMSHELRTPLNAIIGYSELLMENAEDEGQDELTDDLGRINTSANHLLTLISGVLDLSKVEAGRMELVLQDAHIKDLIKDVEHIGTTLARTHHNTLIIAIDDDAPTTLHTDTQKVRQILLNLLSNAFKFTDKGTITLRFSAAPSRQLAISVHDTGIGISQSQQAKLFKAFSQVHGKLERERYGGTGLGLMLCKRMAELLHGSLKVSSGLGKGSTFTLCIPVSIHDDEPPSEVISQ